MPDITTQPTLSIVPKPTEDLALKITQAKQAGYNPEEIRTFLADKVDQETLTTTLTQAYQPEITKAKDAGYSDEEVTSFLQSKGIIPSAPYIGSEAILSNIESNIQPNKDMAVTEVVDTPDLVQKQSPIESLDKNIPLPEINVDADPEELLTQLKTITRTYERDFKQLGGELGITPFSREAKQLVEKSNAVIQTQLEARGVEVLDIDKFGTVTIKDLKTGEPKELEQNLWDSLWQDLKAAKFEIGGALAGASAGARLGFAGGGPLGAFGGGLVGSMAGASLGRGTDILSAAQDLKYKIAVKDLADKMGDAASADGLFSLGVNSLWQLGKGTVKGISHAWDYLTAGNTKGAYQALKETTDLSDNQIIEVVRNWEQLGKVKLLSKKAIETGNLSTTEKEAAIRVFGQTQPGMESAVQFAVDLSKTGGAKLASDISSRATQVSKLVNNITNDKVATTVIDELNNYIPKVKDFYGQVKSLGIEASKQTDFRFNFDKIKPLEKSLSKVLANKQIRNYGIRKDFKADLARIRDLGGLEAIKTIQDEAIQFGAKKGLKNVVPKITSDLIEQYNPNRSFESLLDLRQVVNQIRGDNRYSQFLNFTEMDKAIKTIDKEIGRAASKMSNGSAWLNQWKAANTEYSKMKQLQKNSLFKILTKPNVDKDKAVKEFAKSLAYEGPQTFMQVMARLPDKTKRSVEGSVFKHFLEKSSITMSDTQTAIDFPKLANQLEKLAFTNPETRDLKRLVKAFAEVYKNDKVLAQIAWDSPAGKLKNNIATSVEGKVSMAAHSALFKKIQTFLPTAAGRRAALSLKMRKVLDNPLNAKAVEELKKELPKDPEINTALHQLAIQYAKFGKEEQYGRATIYRVARPGEFNKAGPTQLGEGVLFYTDKATAERIAKATGAKVTTKELPTKRLAQPKDVEDILGRIPTKKDYQNPEVLDTLREKDFAGLTVEDKALLFK